MTIGNLLVYCYDADVVAAHTTSWQVALEIAQRFLPTGTSEHVPVDRNEASVILRLSGKPVPQRVNGIPAQASPDGMAHMRVAVGPLIVTAYDLEAVTSIARGWSHAQTTAAKLWPDPDAFDQAELAERKRIARFGETARSTRS